MIFLFLLIPLVNLLLLLLKDTKSGRRLILNSILILNAVFFMLPLAYAYCAAGPDENMWDENGSGAALWYYFFVLPISLMVLLVTGILKLKYRS